MTYVQPTVALVFDNSLTGYVSPFYGHRYRIEVAPSIGSWTFTQINADYRRYDRILGPVRVRQPLRRTTAGWGGTRTSSASSPEPPI